jgi:basic membrane protein A and related proteins
MSPRVPDARLVQSAPPNRRRFLIGAGSVGLMTTLTAQPASAGDLVIGFIYVGPKDDYGYNQAHAEGAAALKGMPGLKLIEEEKVAETLDVQKTMESMIELDGATLLFPTSFGYFDPHVVKMAEKYRNIQFRHCGGLWEEGKHPKNAGSYFGYIGMCQYLSGIAAAHVTKSKKLGFVAAKPIPQVLMNINSFELGAKSVNPDIVTQVIFTGDWSMPVKEAEATNSLVDSGADVVTCHVDGPKVVVETAERRGIYVCGYHANQAKLAPKGYLTGAEWNWATVYKAFAEKALKGEPMANFVRGGLAENFVKMSPFGPAVPEAARRQVEEVKEEMKKGGFPVIKGPLKDNKGNVIASAGQAYQESAIELEKMNYLVEGVIGAIA